MIVAVIGFASLFVEFLQGIIMMVLDTLAALLFLAGGIAVAVGLRGVSCGTSADAANSMLKNGLINGGCKDDYNTCWGWGTDTTKDYVNKLKERCQMDEADSAFMFLGFIVCAGLVAHTFFIGGRSMGRTRSGV